MWRVPGRAGRSAARRQPEPELDAAEAEPAILVPDLIPGGHLLDNDYPPVEYANDLSAINSSLDAGSRSATAAIA